MYFLGLPLESFLLVPQLLGARAWPLNRFPTLSSNLLTTGSTAPA
jgi:hypothetical protein